MLLGVTPIPKCFRIEAATLDGARHHRKVRYDQLSVKFEEISLPKHSASNGIVVHNLSSHPSKQQQLKILFYDAKISTIDARLEDFVASCGLAPQKCEASEECKNVVRQ
ncbi:unnamed protein product [Dibothriocephalus latus]|uniref:Uncharacterized protein n=1 Tax=Dibothriocephalus latus TaxID=60516 RepID=A0A3P6TDN0_DIBLA|nr:unnamed protein product [Dibothriocephalus latus]